MARIERKTAAEMAADAIKTEIAIGRWSGRLPGSRVLAAETGVSQPTVTAALALLVEQGWLEHPGDRKAFRIRHDPRRVAEMKPHRDRRLIFVTHEELGDLPDTTRKVIDATRRRVAELGWSVEFRTIDFVHAKTPRRSWDDLLPVDTETSMIAVFGRPVIAEWAERRSARMLFLGGITQGHSIPAIGLKSSMMVDEAMERLIALGHRQIVLPLCQRPPTFAASIKDVVSKRLEAAGVIYVASYHTPESEYMTPEVTWRMMETAFARTAPTALVFLDWKELVTASCLLSKLGVRIPEDLSVILLNEQMEADWFVPKLACFRFPIKRLASALTTWVEGKPLTPDQRQPRADFESGESLAPPSARA
ncbi:substrate-binding domain-containing protein [Luteolibacter soli]|uniref:Substrate-binding domain-containing protein n=1 Tax=Luteolibacter soli TaxID=3135280 RepID=A0ABU9AP54_9BACT